MDDKENTKAFPVADVDDTVSFMAAARSLKMPKTYGSPAVATVVDASSEKASASMSRPESRADTFGHDATVSRDDDDVFGKHHATKAIVWLRRDVANVHVLHSTFWPEHL